MLFLTCVIQDAEAVAKDDVQRVLGAADEYKHRWNNTWEEQERRLRQNLQICQFNFDLRQVQFNIFQSARHYTCILGNTQCVKSIYLF